jgi:hypothetical protein
MPLPDELVVLGEYALVVPSGGFFPAAGRGASASATDFSWASRRTSRRTSAAHDAIAWSKRTSSRPRTSSSRLTPRCFSEARGKADGYTGR